MTTLNGRRRTLLAGGALLAAGLAGALFWRHGTRAGTDFEPPFEDICIVPPTRVSTPHPYDPASGLAMHEARPVPAEARCPVCGMYPARFPRWAAQIIFTDGSAHFFDSPVDLFMFLAEPGRFDASHSAEDAAALYVANFEDGSWLDARTAVFVIEARVRGPMRGPDLPAFASTAAAQAFIAAQGGRALHFTDIDPAVVGSLREANHGHHTH